jgi:hypothetical protein
MPTRRTLTIAGYYTTALVGSLLIWGLSAITILRHAALAQASTAWTLTAAYAAAMAWALGFTWLYWRKLDEAAKAAQKFAWFVGSIGALVLTAPIMLFFRLGALSLPHGVTPGVAFGLGWTLLALSQLLGFLIAWAGWWWWAKK